MNSPVIDDIVEDGLAEGDIPSAELPFDVDPHGDVTKVPDASE